MLREDERIPWWWQYSKCRQPDINLPPLFFFPDERKPKKVKAAKTFCQSCPVRIFCLQFANLLQIPDGIFGAATAEEREFLRAILPSLDAHRDILLASREQIIQVFGDTDIPTLEQLLRMPTPSLELIESSYQDPDQNPQSDNPEPSEIVVLVVVA